MTTTPDDDLTDDTFGRGAWILILVAFLCGVAFIAALIFLIVRLALRLAP